MMRQIFLLYGRGNMAIGHTRHSCFLTEVACHEAEYKNLNNNEGEDILLYVVDISVLKI